MSALDWLVVSLYLAAMLAVSFWLGRLQHDLKDYYLGGNRLPWWAVGTSVLATQSSAISFVSVPAFVAVAEGGGLRWLHYELALPLAMLFLGVWLIPVLRGLGYTTIYEFLEHRFDARVRRAVALMFLLARGLATGVAVYATAIVIEVSLGLRLEVTILLIGGVTVVYDMLGGMAAVIVSDVVQAVVLSLGLALAVWFGTQEAGSVLAAWEAFPPERRATLLGAGAPGELWAFLTGGLFLYASYYGCDQSQAQRLLSTRGVEGSRAALALNGIVRFPLTLGYVLLGIVAAAVLASDPQFAAAMADERADYLVPRLILEVVPAGLRGFIYAALLAAAMSSLDSAINALSASTVRDFVERRRTLAPARALLLGRLTTVAWGAAVTGFAFFVDDIAPTVIESINRIGSAFYGPVLAVFVLALRRRRARPRDVVLALAAGVATNLALWVGAPALHWMWWNLIGFAVTGAIGGITATAAPAVTAPGGPASGTAPGAPRWFWVAMLGWFAVVVAITAALGA